MTTDQQAKKVSESIALFRLKLSENCEIFTREELIEYLSSKKCPYPTQIVQQFINNGIIIKDKKKLYLFSNNNPIYFGVIVNIITTIKNDLKKYTIKSVSKQIVHTISEEEAISFLKSKGYKIFKEL